MDGALDWLYFLDLQHETVNTNSVQLMEKPCSLFSLAPQRNSILLLTAIVYTLFVFVSLLCFWWYFTSNFFQRGALNHPAYLYRIFFSSFHKLSKFY